MKITKLILALFILAFTATAHAQHTPNVSRHQHKNQKKLAKKDNAIKKTGAETSPKRKVSNQKKFKHKSVLEKHANKQKAKKAAQTFYPAKGVKAENNNKTVKRGATKAERKLLKKPVKRGKVERKEQPKKAHKSRKDYESIQTR